MSKKQLLSVIVIPCLSDDSLSCIPGVNLYGQKFMNLVVSLKPDILFVSPSRFTSHNIKLWRSYYI